MSAASFDTNILIDALIGQPKAHVELSRVDEPWISRVTWIEVMSRLDDVSAAPTRRFLTAFKVDELDSDIAERAAELRNERRALKLPDAVILATAQLRGRILVTRNTRDFPAAMPGIRVPYTL